MNNKSSLKNVITMNGKDSTKLKKFEIILKYFWQVLIVNNVLSFFTKILSDNL